MEEGCAALRALTGKLRQLQKRKHENGGPDVGKHAVSSLFICPAGYLDKMHALIVGLQTDAPLKRGVNLTHGRERSGAPARMPLQGFRTTMRPPPRHVFRRAFSSALKCSG